MNPNLKKKWGWGGRGGGGGDGGRETAGEGGLSK